MTYTFCLVAFRSICILFSKISVISPPTSNYKYRILFSIFVWISHLAHFILLNQNKQKAKQINSDGKVTYSTQLYYV